MLMLELEERNIFLNMQIPALKLFISKKSNQIEQHGITDYKTDNNH